jgi:hypothetical protein
MTINTSAVSTATRLCPECKTDNCFYPLQPSCHTCADMRASFMSAPLYVESTKTDKGQVQVSVSPISIFQQVLQPWRALLNLLLLN